MIGQAAEFDYSGAQACKVLLEEGYEVVLVNSNPATIMTDPEFATATYVEPLLPGPVAQVIERERPDALLPTLGGQTALNLAKTLHEDGTLARFGVELIGANYDAICRAEDREQFDATMQAAGLRTARNTIATIARRGPRGVRALRPAADHPPGVHARRARRRDRPQRGRVRADRAARPGRVADRPDPDRRVRARLGRVRARGHARPRGQRRDRLLDREHRPDGRAHRRQRHGRAAADADRPHLPEAARPGDRGHPRRRRRDRRLQRAVRGQPGDRRDRRDRDEPARVALVSALASKATGFPIAKIAARLAVGYTLDEIPNDITRATPASFEPTLDYVVVKWPRFAFEKFPGVDATLSTHMKSVGEVMAIGRTFGQAFGKALRSARARRSACA